MSYVKDRKAELKIESGIPVPPRGRGNYGPRAQSGIIAESMDVGDSREFDVETDADRLRDALQARGFKAKIRRGISEKTGKRAWRVWKVEAK